MPFDGSVYRQPEFDAEAALAELRTARNLITCRLNWTQGKLVREACLWWPYRSYCALGALQRVNAGALAYNVLMHTIRPHGPYESCMIENFNDRNRHHIVLKLFDQAVQKLESADRTTLLEYMSID